MFSIVLLDPIVGRKARHASPNIRRGEVHLSSDDGACLLSSFVSSSSCELGCTVQICIVVTGNVEESGIFWLTTMVSTVPVHDVHVRLYCDKKN